MIYSIGLRGIHTLDRFSAISYKEYNRCDFDFLCANEPLKSFILGCVLHPYGTDSILLLEVIFRREAKHFYRAVSPESTSIPLMFRNETKYKT